MIQIGKAVPGLEFDEFGNDTIDLERMKTLLLYLNVVHLTIENLHRRLKSLVGIMKNVPHASVTPMPHLICPEMQRC